MDDVEVQIAKAIEMLREFSLEDRNLADETYAKFSMMLDAANQSVPPAKVPDGVIEGMNRALQLKIASTERLSKIINQLIRLKQQNINSIKSETKNNHKTRISILSQQIAEQKGIKEDEHE